MEEPASEAQKAPPASGGYIFPFPLPKEGKSGHFGRAAFLTSSWEKVK